MLTVFMATHNGADWIGRTLTSFCEMDTPKGGYKLVIIDNASTDDTSLIIERFQDRLPITLLREHKAGKNRALNFGLHHLIGELAVFTDDDVIVPSDWLTKYITLARDKSEFTVFGGRVKPMWPHAPAASLLAAIPLTIAFAVHPDNLKDGAIASNFIWGPNMAVRASLFEAGNRFDETIGPSQGNYIMGSETEFIQRMACAGHLCWFENDIVVQHIIRPNQLTPEWLAGRAQRFGRSAARAVLNQRPRSDNSLLTRLLNGLKDTRVKPLAGALTHLCLGWLLRSETLHQKGMWSFNLHISVARELRLLKRQEIPGAR